MTFELPELVWVWVDDPTYTHGGWNLDKESKNAPYVRGDLYSAISRERYELSAEVERLAEARKDALREAAALCAPKKAKIKWGNRFTPSTKDPQSSAAQAARKQCHDAILALLNEGEQNE